LALGLVVSGGYPGAMPASELPTFRYFPDPVAAGAVAPADDVCQCCERSRGWIYHGSFYSEQEIDDLCPWCIADGSAAARFDGEFTADIGWGLPRWDVPRDVIDVIAHRTPGFPTWQDRRWWTHCDDGAAFVGMAGTDEMTALGDEAIEQIRTTAEVAVDQWGQLLPILRADGDAAVALFRCLHCGAHGGYLDLS
jgi:uncharacterized protein CbrC (UPF0167 family)